jgi:2-amino-4-hydroxy-6-hydroxymethyldihydropteridine diphosphokinase
VAVETSIPAEELLSVILGIENTLGRIRSPGGYQSRTIDIDILFYGEQVISSPFLTVPHPLIRERRFVLLPLEEIAPLFVHPLLGLTVSELALTCPDAGEVIKSGVYSGTGC